MNATDAGAAIGLVQNLGTAGNDTASSTSLSMTLASGAAAGNTVIVSFAMDPAASTVTCSDSMGNTYSIDADVTNGSGTTGVRVVICSSTLGTALVAGNQITVTHPAAKARTMSASEFTGIASSARLDQMATASGNSANPSVGPTAITTNVNELVIGSFGIESKKDDPFIPDALYVGLPRDNSGNTGGPTTQVTINPEYRIVSATGGFSATGTISPARRWAGVIVTYQSPCGDGVIQNGEDCDDGGTTNGDCCSSTCTFEAAGSQCRAATGACDVAETCTGSGGTCPADALASAGTECRGAAGACDVAESCDGVSDDCPADVLVAAGTECRGAAGTCDVAEACDGIGAACPADAKSSAECRGAAGACDVAERCDGVADDCPADAVEPAGTSCRGSAGACDVAETCDGSAIACPTDAFRPATDECRAAAGACDVAESCSGIGAECPADALRTANEICRPSAGACDAAESCNGSSAACPPDALSGPAVTCRVAAGPCDVAEGCNGMDAACPPDQLQQATFICRPSSGACDPEETCSEAGAACPADVGEPDSDGDEVCDSADACPDQSDPAQADGDADGLGDACDPCTNIVPVFASRSKIRIAGLDTPPGDDRFVFKGNISVPTTPPINPAANGIRLLLDDAGANVLDVVVPGGPEWKTGRSGNSWRYRSPGGPGGIVKIRVRRPAAKPGTLKFRVVGRAGTLAVTRARIPVKGTFVVDSPMAQTGQCGETQYDGSRCVFSRSGRSLRCR